MCHRQFPAATGGGCKATPRCMQNARHWLPYMQGTIILLVSLLLLVPVAGQSNASSTMLPSSNDQCGTTLVQDVTQRCVGHRRRRQSEGNFESALRRTPV